MLNWFNSLSPLEHAGCWIASILLNIVVLGLDTTPVWLIWWVKASIAVGFIYVAGWLLIALFKNDKFGQT